MIKWGFRRALCAHLEVHVGDASVGVRDGLHALREDLHVLHLGPDHVLVEHLERNPSRQLIASSVSMMAGGCFDEGHVGEAFQRTWKDRGGSSVLMKACSVLMMRSSALTKGTVCVDEGFSGHGDRGGIRGTRFECVDEGWRVFILCSTVSMKGSRDVARPWRGWRDAG